ncbi:MAG TPA: hypothetical protein VMI33_02760 [Streptosporangiaceae bacterium]|nr:hypothetical protein [Streptosporangiaceae bacterium]
MQAVVNAAHARARDEEARRKQERPPGEPASSPSHAPGGPKPPNGVRLPTPRAAFRSRWPDEDAEFDTDELPRLTASGAIASPAEASPTTPSANGAPKTDHAAEPAGRDHGLGPARRDHAARRDRRATRRERGAQAERERAAQAEQTRQAERERAREAELAAWVAQVQRERAAQAEREQAARAEREQAAQVVREQVAQAERERAAQADRERAEREQAEREQAERERAERAARERAAQAERERAVQAEQERATRAGRERIAGAERERAEREQAERARALRERTERERAERAERKRAEQAERDRAEQAERERAARARLAPVPDLAEQDDAARPGPTADGAPKTDDAAKRDSNGKPESTADPADHEPAITRADVLNRPRRTIPRTSPVRRRRRTAALIAAAAVIVAAGPVAIALSGHNSPAAPDGSVTGVRNQAAAWVARQVSPDDIVSCDLIMCHALEAYGVPVGDLLVLNSGHSDLLDSQVIVSTAAIRQLFGSRLDSVDAPTMLAAFGTGKVRIDIRVIAPYGGAAYRSALRADVQQRKNAGTQLAGNSHITVAQAARRQMISGQVDSQLLMVLTYLATQHPVDILGFSDLGPEASPGVPFRSVYLAENTGAAVVRSTITFLRIQEPDLRPAREKTTRFDGRLALYIEFAAPTPLSLFNAPAP